MTSSFLCQTCGQTHEGLPTDTGWQLPDEVWALQEPERSERARWTRDLCQLDDRYFIRGLLAIPFRDQPGYYGWGVWAELPKPSFDRYYEIYDWDAHDEPPAFGSLANAVIGHPDSLGLPLEIQFGSSKDRPMFYILPSSTHPLAAEQESGLSSDQYHAILVDTGHLGGP